MTCAWDPFSTFVPSANTGCLMLKLGSRICEANSSSNAGHTSTGIVSHIRIWTSSALGMDLQVANQAPWSWPWLGVGLALASIGATIVIYWLWPSWKVRHIPGPPSIFGIGHLHLMEKHGPSLFHLLRDQYGPIYRFQMGRQPLVVVADAELCRQLAVKNGKIAQNRSKPAYVECNPVLERGLFFSRDTQWSSMRNILLPLFHSTSLTTFQPLVMGCADRLCSILEKEATAKRDVNMSELTSKLALDVVSTTSFGTDFGLLDTSKSDGSLDQELAREIHKTVEALRLDSAASPSIILGMVFPILQPPLHFVLERIRGTSEWLQRRMNDSICKRVNQLMENRRQERKEKREARTRLDVLTLLLRAQEDQATTAVLTPEYVSALAYEQLLAGSDTTAVTMASALYCVSGHPEVERKLLREIDAFGPPDKEPTPEELATCFPYLEQVIKEAARLFSVSPLVARDADESMTLAGYHIPKGTWVWMATGTVHMDPAQYPEPEQFRPERFDPESEEAKKRHPYAFLVFGAGPRMCIGYRYGLQEAKLTLIKLYQKFTFRHSPVMENPLAIHFGVISKPKYGVILQPHLRWAPTNP